MFDLISQLTGNPDVPGMFLLEWPAQVPLWLRHAIVVVAVLLAAVLALLITRKVLLRVLLKIVGKSRTRWDDVLVEAKFFDRLSYLSSAIVIYYGREVISPDWQAGQTFLERFSLVWMITTGTLAASAFIQGALNIYQSYPVAREFPLRTIAQVIKGAIYFVSLVLILATILGTDVWGFFTGIGAMTAVLMLVFKDTILGFVASLQLSANRMVRRGDWIEMPKYGADGDVLDVSLYTVKVQNWDKTVTTIPTYALVSNSFKNWRGMSESGGRRIKRSISIDMNSVKFCDDEMLGRFEKIEFIKEYISSRQTEIADYNSVHDVDTSVTVNGRRLTNLGTFRHYVFHYLRNHPKIHNNFTLLVRQLASGDTGLPIEIYCFSNDQAWGNFESIQADIFDHLLAVLPEFDLRVHQSPTGLDFQRMTDENLPDSASKPARRTSAKKARKKAAKKPAKLKKKV